MFFLLPIIILPFHEYLDNEDQEDLETPEALDEPLPAETPSS